MRQKKFVEDVLDSFDAIKLQALAFATHLRKHSDTLKVAPQLLHVLEAL